MIRTHELISSLYFCVLVLCEACRDTHDAGMWGSQIADFLPVKLILYLLTLLLHLIQLTYLLAKK